MSCQTTHKKMSCETLWVNLFTCAGIINYIKINILIRENRATQMNKIINGLKFESISTNLRKTRFSSTTNILIHFLFFGVE